MKHFIVERDCYHGSIYYRKGQIVQFAEHPYTTNRKGKKIPVRHFVPVGAQSVSVENPIQQELHSLERAIQLPQETLQSLYSEKGARGDQEKLDALKGLIQGTMKEKRPAASVEDKKDKKDKK